MWALLSLFIAPCILVSLGCGDGGAPSGGVTVGAAQSTLNGATTAVAPATAGPSGSAATTAAPSSTHVAGASTVAPVQTPSVALPNESEGPAIIAMRPNSQMFAAGAGKKVSLVPVSGGTPVALADHEALVRAITFSIKGDRLATVDESGKVRVWDPDSGRLVADLPLSPGSTEAYALVFTPDSKFVATAGGTATIWNIAKNSVVCATDGAWMYDATFTADQGTLLTTGAGMSNRWDANTCKNKSNATARTGGTFGSWVSHGGKYVAAAAPDGHGLIVYDGGSFRDLQSLAQSAGCEDHIGPVHFSRDGEILLSSGAYKWFRSFRMKSMKTIAAYEIPQSDDLKQIVMFDDGERLLVVRGDKGELVSAVSKKVAYTIDLLGATTFDVSWNMKLLLGASSTKAHLWDTATGRLLRSFPLSK